MKPNRQVFTVNPSKMASSSASCWSINFHFKLVQRNWFHSWQIENFGKSCLMTTEKKKEDTAIKRHWAQWLSFHYVYWTSCMQSCGMDPVALEVEETFTIFGQWSFDFIGKLVVCIHTHTQIFTKELYEDLCRDAESGFGPQLKSF